MFSSLKAHLYISHHSHPFVTSATFHGRRSQKTASIAFRTNNADSVGMAEQDSVASERALSLPEVCIQEGVWEVVGVEVELPTDVLDGVGMAGFRTEGCLPVTLIVGTFR
jgi:hypothetical protein